MLGDWQERIVVDPKVIVGKPLIRGTRLSVEFILDLLANDWTIEQILSEYPQLAREDVMAVLKYAAEILKDMGVPKEAVHIVIYEAPKSNWATGGKLHSEKHAQTTSL